MLRRAVPIAGLLATAATAVALTGASGEDDGVLRYAVELDNAFGLTESADLRASGVKVGQVEELEVDARTARAIATVRVDRPEFGGFKRDVVCIVEPQSLIGEYFLDCEPGKAAQALPDGARIPVEQTGGTVPADLVNNILTRPYRERLGILVAELGATFAARGDDVNQSIARAIPALRETDEVLRILADERRELRALARDGNRVISRLAEDREGIGRFVSEARDAAQASADRKTDLASTIRLFPRFQRELRPSLQALGTAARRQTPALADLRAAAPTLTRVLDRLAPFSDASRPAIAALAEASGTGRRAVRVARPTIAQLRRTGEAGVEPFRNLRFVLEHLDDRRFAIEPNRLSPEGKGFTGLEAILQYPFVQSQAINIFDVKGYILKLNAIITECSQYTDGAGRLDNPERTKACNADLGPNGPVERQPEDGGTQPTTRSASTPVPTTPTPAPAPAPATTPAKAPARAPGKAGANRLELPGLPPIEVPLPKSGSGTEPLLDLLLRP